MKTCKQSVRLAFIVAAFVGVATYERMYARGSMLPAHIEWQDSLKPNVSSAGSKPMFLKRLIESSFIIGTRKIPVKDFALSQWATPLLTNNELGQMTIAGKSFPLLVFGDGLAAGWRDGGLFRAGQQTAFPNLVAHQMGLKNFASPLFDTEHGNGTGYLVASTSASGPRWQEVTNNTAIINSLDIPQLVAYEGNEVSNLASPKLDRTGMTGTLSPGQGGWMYAEDGRRWTDDMIFLWRLKPQADKFHYTYWDMLNENLKVKQPIIVFSVFGFDGWVDTNVKSKNVNLSWNLASSETSPLTILVAKQAQQNGATGVVFTLPNFRHLAYFNWYPLNKLKQLSNNITLTRTRENILGKETLSDNMILLPTEGVEGLFNAAKQAHNGLEFPLVDSDVADENEIAGGSPVLYNNRIRAEALRNGLPVVDLEALYEKIYAGGFTTDDGYPIDGTPKGNFFSSDGIYPSAIGNAVIANETIKVLNQHFKATIPLINVKEFALLSAQ